MECSGKDFCLKALKKNFYGYSQPQVFWARTISNILLLLVH